MSFQNLEWQAVRWIQRLQEYKFYFRVLSRPETTMPILFHEDPVRRTVPTGIKVRADIK